MTAEYRLDQFNVWSVPVAENEALNPDGIVRALVNAGAQFPGNAAGWKITTVEPYHPTPHTKRNGRQIAGKIIVHTEGMPLAHRPNNSHHQVTVGIYA